MQSQKILFLEISSGPCPQWGREYPTPTNNSFPKKNVGTIRRMENREWMDIDNKQRVLHHNSLSQRIGAQYSPD